MAATDFVKMQDVVVPAGVSFAALGADFRMMRIEECVLTMNMRFPVVQGKWSCRELFQTFSDEKYSDFLSSDFSRDFNWHNSVFAFCGSRNYWHFLVDFVGNLPLLKYFPSNSLVRILAADNLPEKYFSFLDLVFRFLDVEANIVREPAPIVRLTNSYIPCVNDLSTRIRFLRDLGRSIQKDDHTKTPAMIFLRRGNVSVRKINNVEDVIDRISREFDFVAVDAGDLSITDQIKLMKSAEIVVGSHGAALTNICFAPTGSDLIELHAVGRMKFFQAASEICGVSHTYFAGRPASEAADIRPDNVNYVIDIDQLCRTIEATLRKNGERRIRAGSHLADV